MLNALIAVFILWCIIHAAMLFASLVEDWEAPLSTKVLSLFGWIVAVLLTAHVWGAS